MYARQPRSLSSSFQLPLPTCWERTPLHEAVKNNHVDVVRLLVEAGADVNVKDERLVSPLLLAGSTVNLDNVQEMANFNEIIRILLSKKAFVNSIHPDTGISQSIVTQETNKTRHAPSTCGLRGLISTSKIPMIFSSVLFIVLFHDVSYPSLIRTRFRQEPRLCITRQCWGAWKQRNYYWQMTRGRCSSAKVLEVRPSTSPLT